MKEQTKNFQISSNEDLLISKFTQDLYNNQTKMTRKELWHYTSMQAVLSIFNSYITETNPEKKRRVSECSMLASNIRFLNDAKEYDDGAEIYNKKQKEKSSSSPSSDFAEPGLADNIYLISLCGDGDLLSQWKWYGQKSGISICFSPDNMRYKKYSYLDENGNELQSNHGKREYFDDRLSPLKIHYKDSEKTAYFDDLESDVTTLRNEDIIDDRAGEIVLQSLFIPFCKDESFSEEKESRLVFIKYKVPSTGKYKAFFDIQYRQSYDGKIKPALNVKIQYIKNKDDMCPPDADGNIISKIIVGPGIDQENIFNALIHIFDQNNFRYHKQEDDPSPDSQEAVAINQFAKELMYSDRNLHIVKYNKRSYVSYRCESGIVIMKSSIPFRG